MQFNVFIMVCIKAFQDFVCTLSMRPNKKLLGYDIAHQWMDVAPPAALSVVMCGAVMAFGAWLPAVSVWLKLGLLNCLRRFCIHYAGGGLPPESFCF